MKQQPFSLQARLNSFGFAFGGLVSFFRQEHNARIHLFATLAVFGAAVYFKVSVGELIALVIVTGFVWVAEMLNTAIEKIMDFISTNKDPRIKFIKDVAAGGVLVAASTALATGVIIFLPKLF